MYRPPVAVNNASIAKVVAGDAGAGNLFAALSANGEVFTFGFGDGGSGSGGGGGGGEKGMKAPSVKPSRVWSLRKQFTAVKVCLEFFLLRGCWIEWELDWFV